MPSFSLQARPACAHAATSSSRPALAVPGVVRLLRSSPAAGPATASLAAPCAVRSSIVRRRGAVAVRAEQSDRPANYNKEFGYSRKDVIIIGVGLIAAGYGLYYGLQATGMDAGMAGSWTSLITFVGTCVAWVGTYVYRVATKQMTYVKQLEQYEAAVMAKRMEEMTEAELEAMLKEVEADKNKRAGGSK